MLSVRRVVVAVSGGVDSAVSALALKKKGFEVCAVFMNNWDVVDEVGECSGEKDEEDARYICKTLDISFKKVSFVKEYWHEVFTYMVDSYRNGLLPNPDIMCNKKIKFDLFFKHAFRDLGADAVATGHYARTSFGPFLENFAQTKDVSLLRAADSVKDQTFFLSQVPQEALRRTMFPIGELRKAEVKRIAMENGLGRIAKRDESMGICFVGRRNFKKFIGQYIPPLPGKVINLSTGHIEGKHSGQHLWINGQKIRIRSKDRPMYVVAKGPYREVFVSAGLDHPQLWTNMFITGSPHWICRPPPLHLSFDCHFLFQHLEPTVKCRIVALNSGSLFVVLQKPLSQLNAGQFAVFYSGEECLGSAEIHKVGPTFFSLGKTVPGNFREYYDDRETLDMFK